jgi:deoxyribodipyrimidine photo-lyase
VGLVEQRWLVDPADLALALKAAASVRSVDDPHICQWLSPVAELQPEPLLFAQVERRCTSFSQWWKRATRGLVRAEELL